MKSITQLELDLIIESGQVCVGSELQNILVYEEGLALGFWGESGKVWLLVDLKFRSPVLFFLDKVKVPWKQKKKPIGIFLKTHFIKNQLKSISSSSDYGRVVVLEFSENKSIEIILFSSAKNIIVKNKDKKICWNKPKELISYENKFINNENSREPKVIIEQWEKERFYFLQSSKANLNCDEKLIQKKEKTLLKMTEDLQGKQSLRWDEFRNYLESVVYNEWPKEKLLEEMAPEFVQNYFDISKDLRWNLENSFKKSKELVNKIKKSKEMIKVFEQELLTLKSQDGVSERLERQVSKKKNEKEKYKWSQIKMDNDLVLWVGKNAKENLEIMRSSNSWDLWLHLRDFPGAHGILHKVKNRKILIGEIQWAAKKIIEKSFKSRAQNKQGESFDIIVSEKRFITPIKGDKLGRVRVRNEKVYSVKYDKE